MAASVNNYLESHQCQSGGSPRLTFTSACEVCQIFKKTYFEEHLQMAASVNNYLESQQCQSGSFPRLTFTNALTILFRMHLFSTP